MKENIVILNIERYNELILKETDMEELIYELNANKQIIKNILLKNKEFNYNVKHIEDYDMEDYYYRKAISQLDCYGIEKKTRQLDLIYYIKEEIKKEKEKGEEE